jgi:hypothetical protein
MIDVISFPTRHGQIGTTGVVRNVADSALALAVLVALSVVAGREP